MNTKPSTIDLDTLNTVTGGLSIPVSPETVGCAAGGAAAAEGGPWASAAGCIVGGAVANAVTKKSFWRGLADNTVGSIKRWGQSLLPHF